MKTLTLPILAGLLLAPFIVTSSADAAVTVPFDYSASNGFAFATGSGSFTSNVDNGAASLTDLSAFSLAGDAGALFVGGSYSFDLGDLTSFSAEFVASNLTNVSFTTDSKSFDVFAFGLFPIGSTQIQFAANGLGPGNLTVTTPFGSGTGDLTPAVASVPEPATWGMMIAGFGIIGFAMRRRQKVATTRVAYA